MSPKVVVEAAEIVSVLRIDTADPQTARTVAMMQGGCDAIGTYPAGGLAILLPDCPPAQSDALARRLRIAMKHAQGRMQHRLGVETARWPGCG